MQRLTPQKRVSLFNGRFARFAEGRAEEVMLADARELEKTLKAKFDLVPAADLSAVFARLRAA